MNKLVVFLRQAMPSKTFVLVVAVCFSLYAPVSAIAIPFDYGDAPATYSTLLADDGARHTSNDTNFLILGTTYDEELDGQPDANALGDDFADSDDEDGVLFTSLLVVGQTASVDVTASFTGYLDAWMDFNIDGDWGDSGEQIFTSQALGAGTNSLSFLIPLSSTAGTTFTRFRLSTNGGLSYTGLEYEGEVEDYQVSINPVNPVPEPATVLLLGTGLVGLVGFRKKFKK